METRVEEWRVEYSILRVDFFTILFSKQRTE